MLSLKIITESPASTASSASAKACSPGTLTSARLASKARAADRVVRGGASPRVPLAGARAAS
ncbi:hypothetical protein [Microbispora sp. GKU 823]|uniref:hypothetical protein n=1 Tax=Microbispora sp. GKU 823 TaxID=1652100 RepID=UPI0021190162|nr:hypothetical protein [Microbispora sp. GKU 823]